MLRLPMNELARVLCRSASADQSLVKITFNEKAILTNKGQVQWSLWILALDVLLVEESML